MIISASRRTDIPAFYSEWLSRRLDAGFCRVPNPFNPKQISEISLRSDDVDCIVFWTKNPAPMLPRLGEIDGRNIPYYYQFTLNGYGCDLEPHLPPLDERIKTFRRLSDRIGPERVIWRYDPIIVSNQTDFEFHRRRFALIADHLAGSTVRCMTSYLSPYRKTRRRIDQEQGVDFDVRENQNALSLLSDIADCAKSHGITLLTCAESLNTASIGIARGHCIDALLIHRLFGKAVPTKKDAGQRGACLCAPSRDIGVPDTCLHGCPYCYATRDHDLAKRRHGEHDPTATCLWEKK